MAQSDLIYYSQPNIYGRKFKCTKRTAAHLDRTKYRLKKKAKRDNKNYYIRIIQGCYNTTVEASAGTHDFDACLDIEIVGMDWYEAQKFLRANGLAAFVRTPAQGFSWHIHMISLPPYKTNFVSRVGIYVPGQINDYYDHKNGLSSHAPDNTWHPDNIRKTIFNYRLWISIVAARRAVENLEKRLKEAREKLKRLLRKQ
jgi:hypothetical protein